MAQTLSRKINILEVNSSLSYAGGQRNMVSFAKYIRKDIFDVTIAAYQSGGPLEAVLKKFNIPYVVAGGDVEKILEVIRTKPIDVIHIHRSGGMVPIETKILSEAKKINPKLVVVEKNVFGKYDSSLEGVFDSSLFQSMMHINERYLPKSGKSFDFNFHKVFYNLVDRVEFEEYRASPEELLRSKERWGIKPGDYVVGKVARPVLEKWSDLIIDMVPYLVKKVPNVVVAIIGCPPSRIQRINASRYAKYFRFIPETSNQRDLHIFYQAIDVLAHSSKIGECNGNTINEAMFWKKPVITNSTPRKDNGQLEQVAHLVNGIIANKPPTFARAIAHVLLTKNVQTAMGEAGFKQISTVNDPATVTARLEKLFIEKLEERGLSVGQKYSSITYQPDAATIRGYRQEYRKRLRLDFGRMTVMETIWHGITFPRRVLYKVKDFVQHKWQSYYGKR